MKLRRAAAGIDASADCLTLRSMVSNAVMGRSFPWSINRKFAFVRPRIAVPLESTTVTGTSTTLTLMLSFNCANALAQQSAAANVTTAVRNRICLSPPVESIDRRAGAERRGRAVLADGHAEALHRFVVELQHELRRGVALDLRQQRRRRRGLPGQLLGLRVSQNSARVRVEQIHERRCIRE